MTLDPHTPPEGTVRDWLDWRADKGGTAVVFPDTGDRLDWLDLKHAAEKFAQSLTSRGAKKGESIAILAPNSPDGVTAFYGAAYGGFRATLINLAAGPDAIAYALTHSEARFAYVHDTCRNLYASASHPGLEVVDLSGSTEDDIPLAPLTAKDDALLMYTSGTTGLPKGVVHSHASLLAGGWTTAIAHDLSAADRGFCVLPIYHINGLCVTLIGSLVSSGSLAMVARFSASRFWEQADAAKITWFSAVPTIISHLLHGASNPTETCRQKIRFGRSASAALAVDTQSAFETRFSVPIVETMGLTETAAQILSNPLPPGQRKIGSPGFAVGCEVAISDPSGKPVPPGDEGEIMVRGPNVFAAYLKNPEATEATFRDGWFRTGDLARMDADGYVFVTGRLKELIIKGGENIAPREVDEALYSHPDVIEAAAFACPDRSYGERVEAAVRVRPGSALDENALIAICRQRLGRFKSPDAVHFMVELPKGPSGKIQRRKLLDLIAP